MSVPNADYLPATPYVVTPGEVAARITSGDHFFIDTRDGVAAMTGRRITNRQPFDGTLADVYATITREDWSWARNSRCKYLLVGLVSVDGGTPRLHVSDRNGSPLTLAQLRWQIK